MTCRKSVFHCFLLWRICGFVLYIKHLHLVCLTAKIWTIEYSIEIFNVLAFVVLISPIAGNGVMPEKIDFYCKRIRDLPGGSDGKLSAYNVRDLASIPGLWRSCGEGNGNPLQYSCLENPMDGRAWQATVHGVTKSQTRLSDFTL